MWIYLNGDTVRREDARISPDDRGFLFGDGVYEVIRAVDGRCFAATPHLDRLYRGLDALRIARPEVALDEIGPDLLRRNGLLEGEATIYIQVTRGAAKRIHCFPPEGCASTVYVATGTFSHPPGLHERGGAAVTHPDMRWSRCDLKTVNLLPNVLAKQHAVERGATEAILVRDGIVTEGASTNVFTVMNGELRTYPASNYILPGITRRIVLDLALAAGIAAREEAIPLEELWDADEIFLTGTTTDVLPIVELDGRPIANGRPGPVARTFQEALAERIATETRASVTA